MRGRIAGYPTSYFNRSGVKGRADALGLMDVENEDLTAAGLKAKLVEWDEVEHGVPSWLYNMTKKQLREMGERMPSGIRRASGAFTMYGKASSRSRCGSNVMDVVVDEAEAALHRAVYGLKLSMGPASKGSGVFVVPFKRHGRNGAFKVYMNGLKVREFKNGTFAMSGKVGVEMEMGGVQLLRAALRVRDTKGDLADLLPTVGSAVRWAFKPLADRLKRVNMPSSYKMLKNKAQKLLSDFREAVGNPTYADGWWYAEGVVTEVDELGYPVKVKVKSVSGKLDGDDYGTWMKDVRGITKYLKGAKFKAPVRVGFLGPMDRKAGLGDTVEGYPAAASRSVYEIVVPHEVLVRVTRAKYTSNQEVYMEAEIYG